MSSPAFALAGSSFLVGSFAQGWRLAVELAEEERTIALDHYWHTVAVGEVEDNSSGQKATVEMAGADKTEEESQETKEVVGIVDLLSPLAMGCTQGQGVSYLAGKRYDPLEVHRAVLFALSAF